MKAEGEDAFDMLKARYREGIPGRSAEAERADTAKLYELLARIGGERLVGPSPVLVEGTYFTGEGDGR